MKVAVSIPDDVFAEADRLARDMRTSRSAIYARAVSEFVNAHSPDAVTEALDATVAQVGGDGSFARAAARTTLARQEW